MQVPIPRPLHRHLHTPVLPRRTWRQGAQFMLTPPALSTLQSMDRDRERTRTCSRRTLPWHQHASQGTKSCHSHLCLM